MDLANKSFKDNKTGEIVKVIDSFENIAILENKNKIDVRRLMNPEHYTEQINPSDFFNNQSAYNNLFEKIKTIETDNIPFDDQSSNNGETMVKMNNESNDFQKPVNDESAIIYSSIDDEKEELARKYGASIDNLSSTAKQNETFSKLLGEENSNELPSVQNYVPPTEDVQRVEVNRDDSGKVTGSVSINNQEDKYIETQNIQKTEDPVHTMFKGIKRSVEFSLDLNLENKIPKLEFIELMEESYEKSIIDFLADDITKSILNDPDYLREKIKEKINDMVYKKPVKKTTRKPTAKKTTTRKPTVKKTSNLEEDLNKISSTRKTPTRKPRVKKEIEKND